MDSMCLEEAGRRITGHSPRGYFGCPTALWFMDISRALSLSEYSVCTANFHLRANFAMCCSEALSVGAWAGRSWNGATLLAAWVTPTPEEHCVKAPFVTFRVGAITAVAPPAGSVTHAMCLGAFIVSFLSVNKQGKCFICRFFCLGTLGNGQEAVADGPSRLWLWLFSPFSSEETPRDVVWSLWTWQMKAAISTKWTMVNITIIGFMCLMYVCFVMAKLNSTPQH